jgi:hypothetical protein
MFPSSGERQTPTLLGPFEEAVGQSVMSCVEPTLETCDHILLPVGRLLKLQSCFVGRPL